LAFKFGAFQQKCLENWYGTPIDVGITVFASHSQLIFKLKNINNMLFTKVNPRRRTRNAFFPAHLDGFIKDVMNTSFSDLVDEQFVNSRPAVNVIEDENGYQLEVAIPGLTKKDIDLNVEKDILTLSAKKEEETTKEDEKDKTNYKRREFNYAGFKRSFHLNETIDTKAIAATYKNGILLVSLPKKAEVKEEEIVREIKIS